MDHGHVYERLYCTVIFFALCILSKETDVWWHSNISNILKNDSPPPPDRPQESDRARHQRQAHLINHTEHKDKSKMGYWNCYYPLLDEIDLIF